MFRLPALIAACAAMIGLVLSASAFAQAASDKPHGAVSAQTEVPDGSPQLAPEKTINHSSTGATGASNPGRSTSTVVVSEERVQGRLASASVSVGGVKAYTIVDPDAGRSDRQPNNGGKRLSPSLWELLRF